MYLYYFTFQYTRAHNKQSRP